METQTKKTLKGWASLYPNEFKFTYENNLLDRICSQYNWSQDGALHIYYKVISADIEKLIYNDNHYIDLFTVQDDAIFVNLGEMSEEYSSSLDSYTQYAIRYNSKWYNVKHYYFECMEIEQDERYYGIADEYISSWGDEEEIEIWTALTK